MATYPAPPSPSDLDGISLSRPVCSLPVTDIPSAIENWTTKLPFYLRGRDGDNHCWLQSFGSNGEVNIYLRRRGFAGPGRQLQEDDASFGKIYIRVSSDDVSNSGNDAAKVALTNLHGTLMSRNATEVTPPTRMPWGHWICAFSDLDGNTITFYAEGGPKQSSRVET